MDKRDKSGGSTNNPSLSRPRSTTNHGISRHLVRLIRCKSGAPTHNGSRSSSIQVANSSMSTRTKEFLMSKTAKMLKPTQLLPERTQDKSTRDGLLSILIKKLRLRLRD